jgi:hypothetical protein
LLLVVEVALLAQEVAGAAQADFLLLQTMA